MVASGINFLRFVIRMGGGAEACELEAYTAQQRDCEMLHSNGPLRFLFLSSLLASHGLAASRLVLARAFTRAWRPAKRTPTRLRPAKNLTPQSVPIIGEVIATPEVGAPNTHQRDSDRQVTQMAALLSTEAARQARAALERGSHSSNSPSPPLSSWRGDLHKTVWTRANVASTC